MTASPITFDLCHPSADTIAAVEEMIEPVVDDSPQDHDIPSDNSVQVYHKLMHEIQLLYMELYHLRRDPIYHVQPADEAKYRHLASEKAKQLEKETNRLLGKRKAL